MAYTYITVSQNYHIWAGIKPKPALRSHSQLIRCIHCSTLLGSVELTGPGDSTLSPP